MSKRRVVSLSIVVVVMTTLVWGSIAWYRSTFPYGHSHCCIIALSFALQRYAEENDGHCPAGEASPEASLSLLYRAHYIDATILRGMTVPEDTVRRILESGGLLGPESCGWHYVPGLTRSDDPRIAMLWCKTALGHNGERTKDGSREVAFIDGRIERISGGKWPGFLQEQTELMKRRTASAKAGGPLVTWSIKLPDGSQIDRFDGRYAITEESKAPTFSGSGSSPGVGLGRSQLIWYRAPLQNGSLTRTLSFSNLVSDPVTVTFTEGAPNVSNAIFTMRSKQ